MAVEIKRVQNSNYKIILNTFSVFHNNWFYATINIYIKIKEN